MKRITPPSYLIGIPCSITSVSCALGYFCLDVPDELNPEGYCNLKEANKYVRRNLSVKKRTDFKRGQRPLLKDLHFQGKAIVGVMGHFIYLDGETYHSFFYNEEDPVFVIWELK
jgi:hypothetical protein